jgi:hypothetical protein
VSCPNASHCWAVGDNGTILFSAGGGKWSSQTSGTTNALYGVSCPDAGHCWAVGDGGKILAITTPSPPTPSPLLWLLLPAGLALVGGGLALLRRVPLLGAHRERSDRDVE